MIPAATTEFRENRRKFTLAELRPYEGKWVAFSADGRRIMASGETIQDVANQLDAANLRLDDVALDHIVFDYDEINLGAAEFM